MPKHDEPARPALAEEGGRTAGTMFAALYGELMQHAWIEPPEPAVHASFHDRSVAMGWLDDRSTGQPGRAAGLWAVNDAGRDHPGADIGAGGGLISWFQVEASAVAVDRPLPVQPFLRCARDATERAGLVRLSAVQVLLPLQGLDPSSRAAHAPVPAMQTVGWFAAGDPSARVTVRVDVDSGQDGVAATVADRLVGLLGRLDQGVFVCRSHTTVDRDAVPPPPFDDSHWSGPSLHGVTLHGELTEWSCAAIGWLAEAVADCLAVLGARTPVLFTATRA